MRNVQIIEKGVHFVWRQSAVMGIRVRIMSKCYFLGLLIEHKTRGRNNSAR